MDEELIQSFKKEWSQVHSVVFRQKEYLFRALTFKEFDDIAQLYDSEWDSAEAEDAVVKTAVLYPYDFDPDKHPAGIITSLADEILIISGFRPGDGFYTKGVLEEHRKTMAEFRNMMKAFIIAAMPAYTDEALDDYTFAQLAKKLAMSEKVIEIQQSMYGIEGSDFKLVFRGEEDELTPEPVNTEEVAKGNPPAYDPIAAKLHQALG